MKAPGFSKGEGGFALRRVGVEGLMRAAYGS